MKTCTTQSDLVGIYVRISEDDGERLGVERQRKDCLVLADRLGLVVHEQIYEDNDVSAFKRTVKRPAFERLLRDVETGALGGVIVYDLDRLARQPRDLERLIDVYERRKGMTFRTVQGAIDLSTPDGLALARVMITFANKASMDTSRRVRRKRLEEAESGKPSTSRFRCYGYNRDGNAILPDEASLLKSCANRILKGQTLRSIARDLNRQGVPTSTGGRWDPNGLRRLLINPRMTSLRVLDGKQYEGSWPSIFDRMTHEQLLTVLNSRSRAIQDNTSRKHLLPGFLYCGVCNILMKSAHRANNGGKASQSYACIECQRVSISMKMTDQFVREHVLRTLSLQEPDVEADSTVATLVAQIDTLHGRIEELDDAFYVERTMNKDRHARLSVSLQRMLDEARRALIEVTMAGALTDVPVGDANALAEAWDAHDQEWRRTLIATVVERIIVGKATSTGRGSKAHDRLTIVNKWRDYGQRGIARRPRTVAAS